MNPPQTPGTGGAGDQRGRDNSNSLPTHSRSRSGNPNPPFAPPRFQHPNPNQAPLSTGATTGSNLGNVNRPRAQSNLNKPADIGSTNPNPPTQSSHARSASLAGTTGTWNPYGIGEGFQPHAASNVGSLLTGRPKLSSGPGNVNPSSQPADPFNIQPSSASGVNSSTRGTPSNTNQPKLQSAPCKYPGPDVNHPFRCIHDWFANRSKMPSAVTMLKGTEGRVLGQQGTNWLEVTVGRTGIRGWFPYHFVEVNRNRTVGDIRVQHDMTYTRMTSISNDFSRLEMSPSSSLQRAIIALMTALREKRAELPFMHPNIRDILINDNQRRDFIRRMISGLNHTYNTVASRPNSTLQELRNGILPVDHTENRTGYYLRISYDFKDDPSRQPEVYTGCTNNSFNVRRRGHLGDSRLKEPSQNACIASAQQSDNMELLPIGILAFTDNDEMHLGEQVVLLLNGTYKSKFFSPDFQREVAEAKAASSDVVREIVKDLSHKEMTVSLITLADSVLKKPDINFTPLRFRKGFGAGQGLNHSSPIAEHAEYGDKLLWIKVEEPEVKQVFYREGLALTSINANGNYQIGILRLERYSGEENKIMVRFSANEPHPSPGTIVYPSWEISLNEPHNTPWARLNGIGLPEDWNVANSLALKVEWEENGQWKSMYQQFEDVGEFAPTKDRSALNSYAMAMGIIRYLQQRTQHNPRLWFYDAKIARVKSLTFNNFTQTIHLKELSPPTTPFKRPAFKTEAQIRREMEDAGCLNVGGTWNVRAWRDGIRKKGRHGPVKACDACYIRKSFSGDDKLDPDSFLHAICSRHVENGIETDTCGNCFQRGLLCSWTHIFDITSEMRKALGFAPKAPRVMKDITPNILFVGELEEELGDPEADEE